MRRLTHDDTMTIDNLYFTRSMILRNTKCCRIYLVIVRIKLKYAADVLQTCKRHAKCYLSPLRPLSVILTSQNPCRERSNNFAAVSVDGRPDLIIIRVKLPTIFVGKLYHSMKYDDSPIFSLFVTVRNKSID